MRSLAALLALLAVAASGCAAPQSTDDALRSCANVDAQAIDAEAADTPPVPIDGPEGVQRRAPFPDQDRRMGYQGNVVVRFVVDAEGSVVCSDVVRSVSPGLDASSRRAVHASRFEPARLDGDPVAAVTEHTLRFVLR